MRLPYIETAPLVFLGALSACFLMSSAALAADETPATTATTPAEMVTAKAPDTASTAAPETIPAWFARIGETEISADEYKNAVRSAYRTKFYHGKPPEAEVDNLMRNTGQELIDRVLFNDEARRRKVEPDHKEVQAQIDAYEKRYASSPTWPQLRETALPPLRKFLEGKSVLTVLEQSIRAVDEPTEEALRSYYDANMNLFTEPEKLKLSLILMRVDPSSSRDQWAAALAEGERLVAELKSGADFAAMAIKYSNDKSADDGGDLGYLHTGMLPEVFQAKVDDMKEGDISDALRTLQGIVIYRLDDRISPALRPFETVKSRAADLLKREISENAWNKFVTELRAKATVEIAPEFQKNMAPPADLSAAKSAETPAPVVK